MSARDAILSALGPPGDVMAIAREAAALVSPPAPRAGDAAAAFVEALARPGIGATVEIAPTFADVPGRLLAYAAAHGLARTLTLADPDLPGDWSGFTRLPQPPVDGGLVVARAVAGVAETGSLVLETGAGRPMLANFLALHHVVVVEADGIVPTLDDLVEPARPPRARYWVTGVSGTTDIEGQYVRGAHGPRFLHVIVIGAPG